MEPIQWFLCFFCLFIPFLHLLIPSKPTKTRLLPPGPRGLPVVGNLFSIKDEPHRAFAELAKLYGPVMTLKLGLATTIVLSSPEAAREAFQTKDQLLSDRWIPDAAKVLGHHELSMVWLPTNHSWKQLRIISATKLLSGKSLESSKHLRRQKTSELIACISKHAGQPVAIGHVIFETVFGILSNVLFSMDMEKDRSSEIGHSFRDLVTRLTVEIAKPNVSDIFPVLSVLDLQGRRRFTRHYLGKLYEIADEIIDSRMSSVLKGTGVASDFLDSLLQMYVDSKLDRPTIRVLILDLLGAGTETTTITLEWAMAELLRNPDTMEKLSTELEQAIGSSKNEVEEGEIERLPYLQAVVKEVLRLHPPGAFILPHKAVEDVELGGYLVPKGTRVLVNIWAIGHDENVWRDPEVFRPERFLEREVDVHGRDFELIPFSSGRRSCPGILMAMKMMHLILASMLHSFVWKLPEGMTARDVNMKEIFGTTLSMAFPLHAVPLPRKASDNKMQEYL